MGTTTKGPGDTGLQVVCPSCEDLLTLDTEANAIEPGDPLALFCDACQREVEVTAPAGLHQAAASVDGAASNGHATEFSQASAPSPPSPRPST